MSPRGSLEKTTVLASFTRSIVEAAAQAGVDFDVMCTRANVSRARLEEPDGRISYADHLAIWRALCSPDNPTDLGLRMGEFSWREALGVVGYLAYASATLEDALLTLERFRRIIDDDALARVEILPGQVLLRQTMTPDFRALTHAPDLTLSGYLSAIRRMVGRDVAPTEVWLPHAPSDVTMYERFFRCPVHAGMAETRMVLDRAVVDLPLVDADPRLRAYVEDHAHRVLGALPGPSEIEGRVREGVIAVLGTGHAPTARLVGRALGTSERSLQRALAASETTFASVADDVRVGLSRGYLADGRSIAEIALLLGYSEASAFHRAFRRWTGQTPEAYRRGERPG